MAAAAAAAAAAVNPADTSAQARPFISVLKLCEPIQLASASPAVVPADMEAHEQLVVFCLYFVCL